MKVLIVVARLPIATHQIKGGVHSAMMNLLDGFSKTDAHVRLLSLNDDIGQTQQVRFSNNIDIFYEPEGKLKFHLLNYLVNGSKILKKHLTEFKPDILHFQNGNSLYLTGLFAGKLPPRVITIHGNFLKEAFARDKFSEKIKWIVNGLINEALKASNIIFLSQISVDGYQPKKSEHYTIIPNAIKSNFFNIPMKEKMENKLLYIGIINKRKNLLLLIDTMQRLRDIGYDYTLEVIGGFENDEYKNLVMERVNKHPIEHQIKFSGWADQSTVMAAIQNSDCLVMTSYAETLPMVIAESMCAGKMVISSAVGGIPTQIKDKVNGYLFDLSQPEQLFNILSTLHNNTTTVTALSNKAREYAISCYESQSVAQKTLAFYHSILHAK